MLRRWNREFWAMEDGDGNLDRMWLVGRRGGHGKGDFFFTFDKFLLSFYFLILFSPPKVITKL